MAEQAQCRAVGGGPHPRDEIRPPFDRAEQLALEAGIREQIAEELLNRLLVAGRIHGVETDQALEQLGGAALQVGALGHRIEYMAVDDRASHAAALAARPGRT